MPDLFAGEPMTLQDQIAVVEREIRMRERVYPRWVAAMRMTSDAADFQTRGMLAVLQTLKTVESAVASTVDKVLAES